MDAVGPDANAFTLSDTGVMGFASPPGYESPADSDSDNVYEVTVETQNDASNRASLKITITVINITD